MKYTRVTDAMIKAVKLGLQEIATDHGTTNKEKVEIFTDLRARLNVVLAMFPEPIIVADLTLDDDPSEER